MQSIEVTTEAWSRDQPFELRFPHGNIVNVEALSREGAEDLHRKLGELLK